MLARDDVEAAAQQGCWRWIFEAKEVEQRDLHRCRLETKNAVQGAIQNNGWMGMQSRMMF